MNLVFRNFWNTLRRYKVASVLNILGLSVAFAAFAVIMMQVRYDLTYDRFHKNSAKIFRLETQIDDYGIVAGASVPLTNALIGTLPQIERGGVVFPAWGDTPSLSVDGQNYVEQKLIYHSPAILRMFDFRIVAGDTARMHEPAVVMLPRSTAEKLFPAGEDPIGRGLSLRTNDWSQTRIPTVQIAAVYEDFPDNSVFAGAMFMEIPKGYNGDDESWGSFNYTAFFQIHPRERAAVEEAVNGYIASSTNLPDQLKELLGESRLTALGDLHMQTALFMDRLVTERANRSTVYTLLSIAILIVLIAAINFVNFATSLVPKRLRSVNTQRILGSTVGAIRASMIFEAVGMAIIALLVGYWIVYALSTTAFTSFLNVDMAFAKNGAVLLITAAVALGTGLLAGLYPAFYITSFQPALVIKGSFGLSPAGKRLRTALISVQYVISLALIITALLMQVQNKYMKDYPLGFDQQNLLTVRVSQDAALHRETLTDQLTQNPSILGVSYAESLLVAENPDRRNAKKDEATGEELLFDVLSVSYDFPKMMGFEVTDGRDFTPTDGRAYHALIFNETGRKMLSLEPEEEIEGGGGMEDSRVVGFMNDFHFKPLHYPVEPMALGVMSRNATGGILQQVYIRIAAGANIPETIAYIEKTVTAMDPKQVDVSVDFLDAAIGNLYAKEDRLAGLITLFSGLAVLISIIGVFGLVLFETQYRRKEIGLRRIHGATIGEILRMLNQNFVRIVVVCFVIAAPIAYYAVRRWLEGFAYKSPIHWWIFAVALLAVGAITVLTVTLQSYRAATENPVDSIKTE